MFPFNFPTKNCKEKSIKMTPAKIVLNHPNRNIKIENIPIKAKGLAVDAKNIGNFISKALKSFDNRLMILPSS